MFKKLFAKIVAVIRLGYDLVMGSAQNCTQEYKGEEGTVLLTKETKFSWITFIKGMYRLNNCDHSAMVSQPIYENSTLGGALIGVGVLFGSVLAVLGTYVVGLVWCTVFTAVGVSCMVSAKLDLTFGL